MIKMIVAQHHADFERQVNRCLGSGWYLSGEVRVFQCADGSYLYVAALMRNDTPPTPVKKSCPFVLPDPDAPLARVA